MSHLDDVLAKLGGVKPAEEKPAEGRPAAKPEEEAPAPAIIKPGDPAATDTGSPNHGKRLRSHHFGSEWEKSFGKPT